MAGEVVGFLADGVAEPLTNFGAVDGVIINPALVAGVVWRVDVDALDLPGITRQQRFERDEVVALDDEVLGVALSRRAGQVWHFLQQPKRHFGMMTDNRLLPDPIQRRHLRGV